MRVTGDCSAIDSAPLFVALEAPLSCTKSARQSKESEGEKKLVTEFQFKDFRHQQVIEFS
jgi:hypothetical protein